VLVHQKVPNKWLQLKSTRFLTVARVVVQLAQGSVYSLHKRATREHVKKHALRVLGAGVADVVAELNYDLPATFKHHKCDPCAFCF
jgi:predicted RNA methylase